MIQRPQPSIDEKDYYEDYTWTNSHHNVSCRVERFYEAWNRNTLGVITVNTRENWFLGLKKLFEIVVQAEEQKKRVRALGSGWSLSDVATSSQYMVNTVPLDIAWIGLPAKEVYSPTILPGRLVMAQCGVFISQLNQWLFQKSLALPTCGSSDGQTIVGAMSTGTHGAAINVGSVQDYVLGLHVITAADQSYWIEGEEKVLSDDAIVQYAGPGAQRINDNTIFQAALVSFGSFGIIASVLLHAEPLYQLQLYQRYYTLDEVRPCLHDPRNLAPLQLKDNPHHVEFIINPYKQEEVIARVMYKISPPVAELLTEITYGLGIDIIELFGQVADSMPTSVAGIMVFISRFLKEQYKEINGEVEFPGNIFKGNNSGFRGKGMSTEFGVQSADAERTLDLIYKTASQQAIPGVLGLRYVQSSKALLSMAKFPTTATFEIPGAYSKTTLAYYHHLWNTLDQAGINYTFHWGQMANLTPENLPKKWTAEAVQKWLDSRHRLLPTAELKQRFSNEFLVRCGLHKE